MPTTVVDWQNRPEPWRRIGPKFRAECEDIATGDLSGGTRLRRRREALGLTLAQVGKLAKLNESNVGRAERGETGTAVVERINAALDRNASRQAKPAA